MHNSTDWDDLRFFLAVARHGTLSGAARALAVNHSTVFRRLNGLEGRLGVRLADRLPGGYALTSAGEALLETAERVEAELIAAERRLSGQDLQLRGTVRMTMTGSLARLLVPALIAPFERRYPEIELELVISEAFLNLTRRDADIALRPTNDPPETLVGRRLCGVASAIYGSEEFLARHGGAGDLESCRWIGLDDTLAHLAQARWLRRRAPPIAMRVNSMTGLLMAAKAGIGLAALPCFMADPEPVLRRIGEPLPGLETGLWVLTHGDLRRSARIRALLDALSATVGGLRDVMEGSKPG